MSECEQCRVAVAATTDTGGLCDGHYIDRLEQQLATATAALEHIAARTSTRDCCKFAALKGYRRRHLKELAAEALAALKPGGEGG